MDDHPEKLNQQESGNERRESENTTNIAIGACLRMCSAPTAASVALTRLLTSCPASCWPQFVLVHGPPQSGKTTLVEGVIFDGDKIDGAACVVSCVSGAIHSRLVLQEIVRY